MKNLIISTGSLKPALKKLSQTLGKSTVLPVLPNLYLRASVNSVELITTDLELTTSYVLPCECRQSFEMLIPFDFFHKLVALLVDQPMDIQLHPQNKGVLLSGGDHHQLGTLEKVEQYPKIPEIPKKNVIELDESFMNWLALAMMSISKDDSRPAMTKASLELSPAGVTMVSTDAHTLFRHTFPIVSPVNDQILISPKIAGVLEGLKKTALFWHAKHMAFKADALTVIATRHNDKYPDYKVVIPNHGPNLEIGRSTLISGLKRASLTNDTQVTFFFGKSTGGTFLIQGMDHEGRVSEVAVEAEYTGETPEICFSPKLMNTMLEQISFEQIRLHIDTAGRAALITSEEDADYLGLIMPQGKF